MTLDHLQRSDPYEGQRTTPGPIHPPIHPISAPVDFSSPDVFVGGFPFDAFTGVHEEAPILLASRRRPRTNQDSGC